MPEGEQLTPARVGMAVNIGLPPGSIKPQWDMMADHEFRRPYRDWDRVWRNWCRNYREWGDHRAEARGAVPGVVQTRQVLGRPTVPSPAETKKRLDELFGGRQIVKTIALLVVLCGVAGAQVRPSHRDVSLKIGPSYTWYHGQTATDTERDAQEQTRLSLIAPLLRATRDIPACASAVNFCRSQVGFGRRSILTIFGTGPLYDDIMENQTEWAVSPGGRHYQIEYYCFQRLQGCLQTAACLQLADNLLDVLNLQRAATRCIRPAKFVVPTHGAFDSRRDDLGRAQAKRRMPPVPDPHALHGTHVAHQAASDALCGTGVPAGNVQDAHLAFEATARNEDERHFFRMKDFHFVGNNTRDPEWNDAEVCALARMQDRFHLIWMHCVEVGDWGCARRADSSHQIAHLWMNLKRPQLQARPACTFVKGSSMGECPIVTAEQYITEYLGKPIPGEVPQP